MTIIEELCKAAHPKSGAPPRELLIREDQLDQLVDALNELRMNPFKDIPKLTADDVRANGCRMYGIPVRIALPHS